MEAPQLSARVMGNASVVLFAGLVFSELSAAARQHSLPGSAITHCTKSDHVGFSIAQPAAPSP
jgi:hypothetical protein